MTLAITFYDGIKYHRLDFINRDADFFGNGVVHLTDFPATVPATPNMTVNIGQGAAWVDGYRVSNDSNLITLTVTAADPANPRIDIIQIGHDDINSLPSLVVKKGVAQAVPVEPGADAGYVKLWAINVPAGATSIIAGDLTDRRTLVPINVDGSQIKNSGSLPTTGGTMQGDIDFNQHQAKNMVFHKPAGAPANPVEGQAYYDTGSHNLYVYKGAGGWQTVGGGSYADYADFVASAGQTVFSLSSLGKTYQPGTNTLWVIVEGEVQKANAYTETDNQTVTLNTPVNTATNPAKNVTLRWFTQPPSGQPVPNATGTTIGGVKGSPSVIIGADGSANVGAAGRVVIDHVDGSDNVWFGTGKTSEPGDLAFGWQTDASGNVTQVNVRQNANLSSNLKVQGDNDFTQYNVTASSVDANGKYTVTTYNRVGGNKYMVSTLSNGPDSNGNYGTMTNVFYKSDGVTVDHTDTWTLTYDSAGVKTGASVVRS